MKKTILISMALLISLLSLLCTGCTSAKLAKSQIANQKTTKKHESIDVFCKKYSQYVSQAILLSQKDVGKDNNLNLKPIYMLPFIMEEL